MEFIHYSIIVNLYMTLKTSYIDNYILYKLMDLICLTNASITVGFISGFATIEFVEMCLGSYHV
jgi:hypothetical protein